jgi:type IV secretory pathway ATPase VirB11/archaellum biosynthesis ATPase
VLGFRIEPCRGSAVEEYASEGARVRIYREGGGYCYAVEYAFPYLEAVGEYVYKVVEYLTAHQLVRPSITRDELGKLVDMAVRELGVPRQLRAAVRYFVQLEAAEYSYLTPLLYDTRLENVNINGVDVPIYVDHRDYGYNLRTNIVPASREALVKIVGRVYAETGRPLNEQYPIQDTYVRLRNGALLRFAAVISQRVARNPPYVSVRIQPPSPISPTELVRRRTVSPLAAAYLWYLLEHHKSVMIIGGTASGKTTLLNSLLLLLPHKRLAVAEETPEIRMPPSYQNAVMLFTSPMYDYMRGLPGSESAIYLIDLVKYILRARPDIVVIGESRGREVHELIQGILVGHGGATTFHAEDVVEALVRLTGEAIGVSPDQLSAFHVIVTMKKLERGRRVASITELVWLRAHPLSAPAKITVRGEEFGLVTVGWYNPQTDAVEVDLRRSFWLQRLGGHDEVLRRAELLAALADRGIVGAEEVGAAVRRYYDQLRKP